MGGDSIDHLCFAVAGLVLMRKEIATGSIRLRLLKANRE